MADGGVYPAITVERVNPAPAPIQFRLLCKAVVRGVAGGELCTQYEYQPIHPFSVWQEEKATELV